MQCRQKLFGRQDLFLKQCPSESSYTFVEIKFTGVYAAWNQIRFYHRSGCQELEQNGIPSALFPVQPAGVCRQVVDDPSSFVQYHPLVGQRFPGQNIVLRLGITHLGAYLFFPLFRLAFQVPVALGQQVQFSQTVRQLVLPLISQETDFFDGSQAAGESLSLGIHHPAGHVLKQAVGSFIQVSRSSIPFSTF